VSATVAHVEAALAIARRDVSVYRTYRLRFPAQVVRSFIAVALFYYISRLVTVAPFDRPDAYFAFAVVGLVIMELMLSTLNALPSRVRQEVVAGTFERLVVSPFGPTAGVISLSVFPLFLALASGVLTLAFAAAVFGMPIRWETLPLSLPIAFVGCLCFVALALVATASVVLFKESEVGIGFLTTAISFLGGFVFPIALLPDWIQWTANAQPFTPTLELLRTVVVGTPLDGSPWTALLKIATAAAVLLPISTWVLTVAIRKSQQRGTIIEY
jgi:ABC-2 type transport system permease protein